MGGGSAQSRVAAEAPSGQHDARRVDVRPRGCDIEDRTDYVLPVGAQRRAITDEAAALPRTVEEQHVSTLAAAQAVPARSTSVDVGVVAVRADDCAAGFRAGIWRQEPGRHCESIRSISRNCALCSARFIALANALSDLAAAVVSRPSTGVP